MHLFVSDHHNAERKSLVAVKFPKKKKCVEVLLKESDTFISETGRKNTIGGNFIIANTTENMKARKIHWLVIWHM